ncbi:MAG: hypothetical protein QHJ81_13355 [Anaerolineae bacterium]|nr:hypothetical protein [Anaerolineae bacterium]
MMIQEPLPTVIPDPTSTDILTPLPTETVTITVTIESDTGPFDIVVSEPRRLEIPLCNEMPKFAPDGNRYICSLGDLESRGLWLRSLDRGLERLLTKKPGGTAAWSPDGRAIAYIERPDQTVHVEGGIVKFLDLESGQEIEAGITDFTYRLDFTPDGKLVYHRRGELRLFDPTLRSERAVPGVTVANNLPYYYSEFKFSPDGKRIAGLEVAYDQGVLTVVDIETGQRIKISDQIGPPWGPFDWSPDGQQLAYSIVLEETRFPELWLVNADGSEPRRLCTTDQRGSYDFVTWLPNGKAILFVLMPGSGTDPILWSAYQVISPLGGEPKTLFTGGASIQLVDQGRQMVFYRFSDPQKGEPPGLGGDWVTFLSYQ